MKLFVFFFLVGCATASFHDYLDEAAEDIYHDFMVGMEDAGSLKNALGLDSHHLFADETENDLKTELGKRLREALDRILEKVKESIDKGKVVSEDLQNKLKEIREKMKGLKVELGDKSRELLKKIKEKTREFLRNLLDKLGEREEVQSSVAGEDLAMLDLNLKELFRKLKKELLGKIDKDKLKAKIEEIFGKGSEMADALEKLIDEKGEKYKQKLLDLIDRFLGKDAVTYSEMHGISDYWEKIKDYFKDVQIDLKEKYMKFGDWVKKVVGSGLDKSKTKIENIRQIAKEFIEHTKGVSKDVAEEALEFLRPYKEDLGDLYKQVKETVKDILNKN